MAARSSLYNEDRNLLRKRESERRNQEAHQEKELYLENAPLFGEPYKTKKGDELSSRIQRMLGNYEEVRELIGNNPHQSLVSRPKNLPPTGSYSKSSRPPHTDKTLPPFQNPPQFSASQPGPPSGGSAQALKKLPSSYGPSSLGHGPGSPDPHQRKSQAWPDLGAGASPPPILPTLSPPTEPLSPLHSSDHSDSEPPDADDKDSVRGRCRSPGHGDASHPEAQDIPSQASEGAPLPSQTFPPPLPSKPNLVMPQKPTAYVRPMDGQDQVPSESPDLKPSPEDFHGQPYENLPDLKSSTKPGLSKLKIPSQPIETLSNEAHCVEEILREMTHSWPPPLTAIHTPSTTEPSKFSFPAKETQHVHSGFSGQKRYGSSPKAPSSNCQQGSSVVQGTSAVSAHSSGGESGSSSDSESTSGSESDSESSESGAEEAPPPQRSNPPAPKADAPTANKWQLDNWLKQVNQQNSNVDSQGDTAQSLSPATKQQQQQQQEQREDDGEAGPAKDYKSQIPALLPEFGNNEAEPAKEGPHGQPGRHKSPARTDRGQRKTVGSKHPSKAAASAPQPEEAKPGLRVESVEVAPRDLDRTFTERPKVKTKSGREKAGAKADGKKPAKRGATDRKKPKEPAPKEEPAPVSGREEGHGGSPSPARARPLSPPPKPSTARPEKPAQKKSRGLSPSGDRKRGALRKSAQNPARALVVKIELSLLSRVPEPRVQAACPAARGPDAAEGKRPEAEKGEEDGDGRSTALQACRKRPGEKEGRAPPKKKPKLDKEAKPAALEQSSSKSKAPKSAGKERDKRKSKSQPVTQELPKGPGHKRRSDEAGDAGASRDSSQSPAKHKKGAAKRSEHPKTGKKAPKGSFEFSVPVQPAGAPTLSRPLLKFEDRQYPVEYHMKEAKKLKHKADATSDKVSKAFNYLDAAMSFVESGIAMETDPQTPKSAYTMFSETVDLIRFILKLKNSLDPSAPASEKDFAVLCMRCQSLLQMAMFRYKREAALKYSRTLSEHFKNSSRSARAPSPCVSKSMGTPSPMSPMPSPASSASSGPGSNHSSTVTTVAIPQVIQQVASSYVNITALFLSAHDTWEQAEALAQRGSGLLLELDSTLGALSLTSSMTSLVRYTRQGLHWLRLDANAA
ncbi:AF4/FMR2 family member 1 [Megalops cyprinoides]|uniref:AF4/FMR2 family member 1 n=1 Tax=Megalops cyprinoides TaxID=118141 RepID=UPI001863E2DB|nr:AF4/FMR2 family member 1 [Megalops cyprinoides]